MSDLLSFAKEYLGVQEVPAHIKILLEGMSGGSKIIVTGRKYGRTTANNIYTAYRQANRIQDSNRTTPINTTNGEHGEK